MDTSARIQQDVDEAAFSLQIGRRRATRGGNLTVMAAIGPAVGIVNWRASFGSMNTEKFVEFLEGMLANEKRQQLRERLIFVMDNVAFHKTGEGHELVFLPPFPPGKN